MPRTSRATCFPSLPSTAPAAYLLDLTVRNVRCFGPEPQTLRLADEEGDPAQWTVILSDNGCGKTTLLQCLVALDPGRHTLVDLGAIKRSGDRPLVDVPVDRQSGWRVYRVPDQPTETSISGTFKRLSLGLPSSSMAVSVPISWRLYAIEPEADEELSPFPHDFTCYGYGATRRMGSSSLAKRRDLEDPTASLFRDDVYLIDAEEWLLQEDYARHLTNEGGVGTARVDRIRRLLVDLLPGVTDLRIEHRFAGGNGPRRPNIEVYTPYGWVALVDLSHGYRTMIAWTVDLASRMFDRYPNSPNPLAEPAVVLVDEIDLHLHPKWQRQIKSHLLERFPNTQFIVTAHSPLVVQASENENIVVLRREGDHVVIDNDVETVRGWRVDQVLTSDLFGLSSARPPEYEALINERNALLEKTHLSTEEEARLRALGNEITSLPTGETPADLEAMEIIRQAAAELKTRQTSG